MGFVKLFKIVNVLKVKLDIDLDLKIRNLI